MYQISIFDLLDSTKEFCKDHLVNQLVADLDSLIEMNKTKLPNIARVKKEYGVWEHVERLGKRLSYHVWFDNDFINDINHYCGIGVEEVERLFNIEGINNKYKDIDISIIVTPTAVMISTIKNKKRKE